MEIMKVTSANFEDEVLNSDKTVLIDFYADWCGPCKMFSPVVEAVATENEDLKVVKVNVDDAQDLAIQYQVMSIPTTVVIKEGKEVNRAVGMVSKSDLLEMVK
ncbi:MAG: thioredoxin [Clostridia bacterium]|nr:thioredoxin [Clostridia bacterium]